MELSSSYSTFAIQTMFKFMSDQELQGIYQQLIAYANMAENDMTGGISPKTALELTDLASMANMEYYRRRYL